MAKRKKNMRRAALALFAGVLTVSCVDLFHSTDFATLCTDSPTDPKCADAGSAPPPPATDSAITTRPHPNFCSWGHATVFDNATKVCARLGACVGPIGANGLSGGTEFGACVIAAQLAFDCTANPALRPANETDAFWSCVSTAASCDDIRACVYPKGVDSCGDGKEGGTGSFLACGSDQGGNANVQIDCLVSTVGPSFAATPCVMNGQTCARNSTFSSTCSGTQGFSCATPGCADTTHASDCVNLGGTNVDQGVDCAAMSASCVDQSEIPGCKPTTADATAAPACSDEAGAATCVDGGAQACIGGKLVQIDCAHLGNKEGDFIGLPCDVTTAPPGYAIANACVDNASKCMTSAEGCFGALLVACARGRDIQIDCTTAGLDTCEPGDGTATHPPHCKSANPNPTF